MFAFRGSVLLMCVWAGDMMRDAYPSKEVIEFFIFTSPIRLHCNNFPTKRSLDKGLELLKFREYFRFMFQQIDPCEFAEIINEAKIILSAY